MHEDFNRIVHLTKLPHKDLFDLVKQKYMFVGLLFNEIIFWGSINKNIILFVAWPFFLRF